MSQEETNQETGVTDIDPVDALTDMLNTSDSEAATER